MIVVIWLISEARISGEEISLTGIVVDAAGSPVPSADVGFRWEFLGDRLIPINWAFTDDAGHFVANGDVSESESVILAFSEDRRTGCVKWISKDGFLKPAELTLQPLSQVRFRITCSELNTVISSGLIEFEAVNPRAPAFPESQDLESLREWYKRLPEGMTAVSSFGTPTYSSSVIDVSLPPGQYLLGFNSAYMSNYYLPLTVDDAVQRGEEIRVDLQPEPLARLVSKPAPDWHISDSRGIDDDSHPKDFLGKWLLLQFWRYDNERSVRRTMPELIDFHQQHPELRDTLQIVAIHHNGPGAIEQLEQELVGIRKQYWKDRDLPFPLIVDATARSADAYAVNEVPKAVLVNPRGLISPFRGFRGLKDVLNGRIVYRDKTIEEIYPPDGRVARSDSPRSKRHIKISPKFRLTDHKANADELFVDAKSNSVFSGGMDMALNHYDLTNGKLLRHVSLHEKITFSSDVPPLFFHRRRNMLVTTRRLPDADFLSGAFRVESFDLATLKPVANAIPELTGPSRLAMADNTLLVARRHERPSYSTFTVLDFESGEVVGSWKSLLRVDVLEIVPDGTTVVCAGTAPGQPNGVFAFPLATGKREWFIPLEGILGAVDIAISPDGNSFIASDWQDQIHLRSVLTGIPERTLSVYNHKAMAAAFSPDGKLLATGGANSSPIIVWNNETGERIAVLIGHRYGRVHRMRFADNSTLVTCGGKMGEGEVCIWNVPRGP